MANLFSKYSLFKRFNLEDMYNAFLGMEQRQQVIFVAGLIFALIAIIVLPISCAGSKLAELNQQYDKGDMLREDLMKNISLYQSLQRDLKGVKNKFTSKNAGSLTTIIESMANQAGIGSQIDRLKPINLGTTEYYDEEGVDASLSKVNIVQLVEFMNLIESYKEMPLKVSKFQVKPRFRNRDELSVTFQVSTIRLRGGEGE